MFARIRQGIDPVFLLSKSPSYHQLRMVRFEMMMTLLVMMTCLMVQSLDHSTTQAYQPIAAGVPTKTAPVQTTQATEVAVTPAAGQGDATAAVLPKRSLVISTCQPAPSVARRAIDLGSYGEGLTIVRDGAQYYQVYGDDRSTLQGQLRQCGPQHEYAADASYHINWSYALRGDESGVCRVVGVKVGVRTGMILPFRATSGNEPASLLAAWQAFSNSLKIHEDGHTQLAEQYAAQLLYRLQNYQPGDCYTMGSGVEATANGVMGQLRSAQAQYDTGTNHGVTQGAIF